MRTVRYASATGLRGSRWTAIARAIAVRRPDIDGTTPRIGRPITIWISSIVRILPSKRSRSSAKPAPISIPATTATAIVRFFLGKLGASATHPAGTPKRSPSASIQAPVAPPGSDLGQRKPPAARAVVVN